MPADGLDVATLTAWEPISQAVVNQQRLAEQYLRDVAAEAKEEREEKELERREKEGKNSKAHEVSAGGVVDALIKDRCRPLYESLDLFAPPHAALAPFIIAHLAFWYLVPWYLHFLLPYPLQYVVPLVQSSRAVYTGESRFMWLAFWTILVPIDYLESVLFGDSVRELTWWPQVKLIFSVVLYSSIELEKRISSREVRPAVSGATKLIAYFLPDAPKPPPEEKEDTDKDKDKEKEKEKEKERARRHAQAEGRSSSRGGSSRDQAARSG